MNSVSKIQREGNSTDSNISYKTTEEDSGLYVKEVLQRRLHFSSRLMRKLKFSDGVKLNGKHASLKQRVEAGCTIDIIYPEERSYFEPYELELDVPYEDNDLLVVNKPAGLVVHPTKGCQDNTLANALVYRMKNSVYKPRFVNRLDRDTSGLVIVGKNSHCQDFLMHEMEMNRVEKVYYAIVKGLFEDDSDYPKSGRIDLPIDKDQNHTARRCVCEDGYPSVTCYDVIAEGKGHSLVRLVLETGRTHQIRVHMSHIGHVILGDDLYGYPSDLISHQALHAAHLSFKHPCAGEYINVKAAAPADFIAAAAALGMEANI